MMLKNKAYVQLYLVNAETTHHEIQWALIQGHRTPGIFCRLTSARFHDPLQTQKKTTSRLNRALITSVRRICSMVSRYETDTLQLCSTWAELTLLLKFTPIWLRPECLLSRRLTTLETHLSVLTHGQENGLISWGFFPTTEIIGHFGKNGS